MPLFTSRTTLISNGLQRFLHNKPKVRIVEVGPRDGLQNEAVQVSTPDKIKFINKLSKTGLQSIEVTSFVSPKWVPQMSDNSKVFQGITRSPNVDYPVLIPNVKGLQAAVSVGVEEIAVFASASEGFAQKNTNSSVQQNLNTIKETIEEAKKGNVKIRGYVSCVVGCPYDGFIKPGQVTRVVEKLLEFGCYEISLGDTIGVGTQSTIKSLMKDLKLVADSSKLAIHCHDTYGQALVNICTAMEFGVNVIDSSVSGLGGCPYAKGATGNVASEDLVYMLEGMGLETGVNLELLIQAGHYISQVLGKPSNSKVNRALYKKYCMS